MGLKRVVENKTLNKMPLSKKEKKFLELQELVKTKGEDFIGSDYLMELMEWLDWEDIECAGISSEKLEEVIAEQGIPLKSH